MKITMTATYEDYWWEGEGLAAWLGREAGFADPRNPWAGFKVSSEHLTGEEFRSWKAENVEKVTFNDAWSAAEFALDFPGGVWGYSESVSEIVDYRTVRYREATLHIEHHSAMVFELMDIIKSLKGVRSCH